MKLKEIFTTSVTGLKTNKARSFLTILGIVIGISSVVTALSVGQGAEKMILDQMASLGANNIFIEPGAWSERQESGSMMQAMAEEMEIKTLKTGDEQALEKLPSISMAAPYTYGVSRVQYNGNSEKMTYFGTDADAAIMDSSEVVSGRLMSESDVISMARVVVLGYTAKEDLFREEEAVGQSLRIKKSNFRVIGVLEEKGPQAMMDTDGSIMVPVTTAQKLLIGEDHLRFITVQAVSEDRIEEAVADIRMVLRDRHNIYNPEGDTAKDDFKVMTQDDTAEMISSITSIFTVLLASIAAISLVVGGVGIMNIMLVSVVERTREIGLRKAVGASGSDILNQFLMESVLLTLIGGVIGLIAGILFSTLASLGFKYATGSSWGFFVPVNAFLLSLGVSSLVGLVFGIYPAKKASKLDPIEALRYE